MTNNIDFDTLYGNVNALDFIKMHFVQESLIIPGKTTPKEYSVDGEIAVWKELYGASAKSKSSNVREDMVGDDVQVKLHPIEIDKYIGFDVKINGYDLATNTDMDFVAEQTMDAFALSVREMNRQYMALLQNSSNYTAATDTNAITKDNVVAVVTKGIADFKTKNAAYGLFPSVIYISPELEVLLILVLGDKLVKNETTEIANKGYIGSAFGVDFITSDLVAAAGGIDFVIVGKESTLVPFVDMGEPYVNPFIEGGYEKKELIFKKAYGFATIDQKRVIAHKHSAVTFENGWYDLATGTFSVKDNVSLSTYDGVKIYAYGSIPFVDADALIGYDSYRLVIKIKNPSITAKSDLPSGDICLTTGDDQPDGWNKFTKSAFEDDGSLILISGFKPGNKKVRDIKIAWTKTGDTLNFVNYKLDVSALNF